MESSIASLNIESEVLQIEFNRLEVEIPLLTNRSYNIRVRADPMQIYSENQFRRRFCMSKNTVRYLYDLIGAELEGALSDASRFHFKWIGQNSYHFKILRNGQFPSCDS